MAEYRYYLIPDAMTRAFPEQFGKQTPTEFFDNIADLEKRYHQLREMPYNNERTWNERARFPYARLVVGVDRQNPDGEVSVIQVRNGIDTACVELKYADGSMISIDTIALENEVADNMYERSELDWLIYNAPAEYADLVLNGDPVKYLKTVTVYKPFEN